MASSTHDPRSGGLGGVLRITAAGSVVGLALLGLAVVFELLPREALAGWSTKLLLAGAIVAAASAAVALLLRSRPSGS